MNVREGMRVLAAVGLLLVCAAPAQSGDKETGGMKLENAYATYVVGSDGRVDSFIDKSRGKEYLAPGGGQAFMSMIKAGKTHKSASLAFQKETGELVVGFGDSGVTARFKVKTEPHYFTFELAGNVAFELLVKGLV